MAGGGGGGVGSRRLGRGGQCGEAGIRFPPCRQGAGLWPVQGVLSSNVRCRPPATVNAQAEEAAAATRANACLRSRAAR